MDKRERLDDLINKLQDLSGLNDSQYQQILKGLANVDSGNGKQDAQPKVALFDAKTYDTDCFNLANKGTVELYPISVALDVNNAVLAKGCKVVCIFVNDKCDASAVEVLANVGVELIALRCAGFNNVDLAACEKHGISVVRVPEYSPHAVAEHTVALMLMLNRHLHKAYLRNRSGQFVLDGLVGFDMFGKTVGVLGTGKIGTCVIDILTGFGCNILAFDKYPNPKLLEQSNVKFTTLDEIEEKSDIITMHIPLTEESKHLINADSIKRMKKGVMLINTSRGGLVDTKALIEGLKQAHIGSAGLDVYEEEAGIFFHDISDQVLQDEVFARLLTFGNVLITSHQAFLTQEALSNIATTTLSNIEEYIGGKRMKALTNSVL